MVELTVTLADVYNIHQRMLRNARSIADTGVQAAVRSSLAAAFDAIENAALKKALGERPRERHPAK